jgi:hypothetical protein
MEGTDSKPRRSVVEQFLKKPTPRHEPEVEEAMEAFQEARAKSREALMLDVRLIDGTIQSFDYASLRRVKYSPDGTLTLRFGRDKIVAEGKNLERLRCAISEHRARFIQQGTDTEEGLKADDAPHIDSIEIEEGDDES